MLTRCPNCHTIFRIREDQLQMADGLAHCYRCEQIFNAREHLSEEPAATPQPPSPPRKAAGAAATATPAETPPLSIDELLARPKKRRSLLATLFWLSACLTLLATALLQLAWFERQRLIQYPEGRWLLQELCHYAPCQLPIRRDLSRIRITERQIRSHPDQTGALLVQLTIQNLAPFAQPYPILELSLSTTDGQLVARRSFTPAEYLGPADATAQMPPGALQPIEIEIEDPGAEVTGFEFNFF